MNFSKAATLLVTVLSLTISALGADKKEAGLIANYYGNPNFWFYAGQFPVKKLKFKKNLNKLKWPHNKWEKSESIFNRQAGWSIVVKGNLKVPQSGNYRFFWKSAQEAKLKLSKGWPDLTGKAISLKAGETYFSLFIKSDYDVEKRKWSGNMNLAGELLWQDSNMKQPQAIPPALLSHNSSDVSEHKALIADVPLKNPTMPFIGARDYKVNIPKDGFYRFFIHFKGVAPWWPYYGNILLDGKHLVHFKGRGKGRKSGFFNALEEARFLKKGTHQLRIYSHSIHLAFTDMDQTLRKIQMGFFKISSRNPELSLNITEKNRDNMVFRRGNPMILKFDQLAPESSSYIVEVFRQRQKENSAPVWKKKLKIPASAVRVTEEIEYPCEKEGAFEYRVVDEKGKIICGPWAFVVIDPTPTPNPPTAGNIPPGNKILVDSVDCSLENDTKHKFRDNGTSKVIDNKYGKYRITGKSDRHVVFYHKLKSGKWVKSKPGEKKEARYTANDWFAYTLKVKHPGKPHMVTAYIPNDKRRKVPVVAYDQVTGQYNAAIMDSGDAPASAPFAKLSFLVWPNGNAIDVSTFCDNYKRWPNEERVGAIAKIELYEFPDGLPPLPQPTNGWSKYKEFGWQGEQIDIGIEQRMMPKFWSGNEMLPGIINRYAWGRGGYHDWQAMLDAWSRFGKFSMYRGDNLLIWPMQTYGISYLTSNRTPNAREAYGTGYKYRPVDRWRRDEAKMILLLCHKFHVKLVMDFMIQRIYAKRILTANGHGQQAQDSELFLVNRDGKVVTYPARIMNPVNPICRQYIIDWVGEIAKQYGKYPAFQGINIRQSVWHINIAGWFPDANIGYGDYTIQMFEKETGLKVPGKPDDPLRFRQRRDFLVNNKANRKIWFTWRSDKVISLREAMLREMRKYAPHACLYSNSKPAFVFGQGLDDKRLKGRHDLGYGERGNFGGEGMEINQLDPETYKNFDIRKGVKHRTLDNMLGNLGISYPWGLCSGHGSSVRPYPYELEEMAKAMAERPLRTILYGGCWILPAMDDGIRKWVRRWRSIPGVHFQKFNSNQPGIALWWSKDSGKLVFYLINTTDIKQEIDLKIHGSGRDIVNLATGKAIRAVNANGFWTGIGNLFSTINGKFQLELAPFGLQVFEGYEAGEIVGISSKPFGFKAKPLPAICPVSSLEGHSQWKWNFRIVNPKGLERENDLVIIKGSDLLKGWKGPAIKTGSIRILINGHKTVSQVDEKDHSSEFVKKPNGILDANDEICFQYSCPNGVKSINAAVLWGGSPLPQGKSDLMCHTNSVMTNHKPYNFLIKNGLFELGIVGKAPKKATGWKKGKQGMVNMLKFNNYDLLSFYFCNSRFPAIGKDMEIESVEMKCSGPVRTIIETKFNPMNLEWFLDNNWSRTGCLENLKSNYQYQICANSPIIEVSQNLSYEKKKRQDFKMLWAYMNVNASKKGIPLDCQYYYAKGNEIISGKVDDLVKDKIKDDKLINHAHVGSYDGLVAFYNQANSNGFALIGESKKNLVRMDIHKGPKLSNSSLPSSFVFGVFYQNHKIPPRHFSRKYWFVPLKQADKSSLLNLNQRFSTPPQLVFENKVEYKSSGCKRKRIH